MNQSGIFNNRIASKVDPSTGQMWQSWRRFWCWLLLAGRQRWMGIIFLIVSLVVGLALALLPELFFPYHPPAPAVVAGWFLFGSGSIWAGYRLREFVQPETGVYQQLVKHYHQILQETSEQEVLLDRLILSLYQHLDLHHLSLWRYRPSDGILILSRFKGSGSPLAELPLDIDLQQLDGIRLVSRLPESALSQGLAAVGIQWILSLRLSQGLVGLVGLSPASSGRWPAEEPGLWLNLIAGQLALAVKSAYLITDLEEALNKLQLAYRRTVEAEEKQRRHLAVELHDDILSRLTMMTLTLRNSRKQLANDPDPIPERLQLLEKETQSVTLRLREITQGLYPSVLADLGLLSALEAYVDSLTKRAGTTTVPSTITLTAQGFNGTRLAQQNLERDLYYIIRQALDNALTHAQADQIFIHLRWRQDAVSITVQDTGCGMKAAPETLMGQNGRLGLLSINERILAWQGQLTFETVPGRGTTVHARLPTTQSSPDPTFLHTFTQQLQPLTESPVER